MDPLLNEIKQLRRKCNLTQTELASHAGVSQSLIAKIEAGRLDPTYSKAKKILDTLHNFNKSNEKKACDIMCTKLIKITKADSVSATIKKMRDHGISQMPVYDEKQIVGIITESRLLDALIDSKGDITTQCVGDFMEEVPPLVPHDTPISVLTNLLACFPLVFVAKKGNIEGIVTKADLLSGL